MVVGGANSTREVTICRLESDTAILAKSAALLTAATIPFSDVTITETFAEATKNLPLHFSPKAQSK